MFSLVSGFWKWWTHKQELRFLIVGIDNAGKTTTIEQIKRIYGSKTPHLPLDQVIRTIGLNLCQVNFDRSSTGVFWDLGGQLMLRSIWENHYNECDGLLFVLDSTDAERFSEVRSTILNVISHPAFRGRRVPSAILMNKQDIEQRAYPVSTILQAIGLGPFIKEDTKYIEYNKTDPSRSITAVSGHLKEDRTIGQLMSEEDEEQRVVVVSSSSTGVTPPPPPSPLPSMNSLLPNNTPPSYSTSLSNPIPSLAASTNSMLTSQLQLVCVAACSAVKNINIKETIEELVARAKLTTKRS